ncbi:MAG: TauD/TfdA family dioxygenase [Alphaproteobacteria bacterium]
MAHEITAREILDIPAAWKGSTFDFRERALRVFTPAEVDELEAAVRHLRGLGEFDLPDVTPATFPLPTLAPRMARMADELRHGSGVVLLRGIPRERFSADDIGLVYYGLGVHMGRPLAQSYLGELLGSVIDVSDVEETPRGYHAGGRQGFHTDGSACDIVGLMCLRGAKSGGASRIVSAVALRNALVERRPEFADAIYDGYYYRKMDNDAKYGRGMYLTKEPVAVFAEGGGEFFCNLNGGDIRRAVEKGDATLSPLQAEAYDELQKLAASPEFHLDMDIGEGDIQFLNNRTILHSRLGYDDHPELARRRHMLRIWLEVPGWPARPPRQMVMTTEDCTRWATRRTPRMELPSVYLGEMQRQLGEREKAGTVLPLLKPYEVSTVKHMATAG